MAVMQQPTAPQYAWQCGNCASINPIQSKYCVRCGNPASETVERAAAPPEARTSKPTPAKRSSVSSRPMRDAEVVEDHWSLLGPMPSLVWVAVGILALLFAVPGWLAGARLTLAGWLAFLNAFGELFGAQVSLAIPVGLPLLLATLGAGAVYSLAEVGGLPVRKANGAWRPLGLGAWLVYLIALASDWGSTAYGLLIPNLVTWPDAVQPLVAWVTADLRWVAVVSIVLSHYPELLFVAAATAFRHAWHRVRD